METKKVIRYVVLGRQVGMDELYIFTFFRELKLWTSLTRCSTSVIDGYDTEWVSGFLGQVKSHKGKSGRTEDESRYYL